MKFTKILLPIVSSAIVAIPPLTIATSCSKKSLDSYTWEEIKQISKSGDAAKYFKIGDTKKVQLKTQDVNDNGRIDEDEVYQTVRIIGFGQDYDYYSKKIGITFEFVDKICDPNGLSIATYWNDFEGADTDFKYLDYATSSVRSALVGVKDVEINWFRYFGREGDVDVNKNFVYKGDEVYHKPVVDMLPDDLKNNITPAAKLVNTYKGMSEKGAPTFQEMWVTDPLFLLSPTEVGYEKITHERWCPVYSYYEGHIDRQDAIRIKTQIATEGGAKYDRIVISGHSTSENKSSFAGCDNGECLCPDWLRSPNDYNDKASACAIDDITGSVNTHIIRDSACGVAPAFCI